MVCASAWRAPARSSPTRHATPSAAMAAGARKRRASACARPRAAAVAARGAKSTSAEHARRVRPGDLGAVQGEQAVAPVARASTGIARPASGSPRRRGLRRGRSRSHGAVQLPWPSRQRPTAAPAHRTRTHPGREGHDERAARAPPHPRARAGRRAPQAQPRKPRTEPRRPRRRRSAARRSGAGAA